MNKQDLISQLQIYKERFPLEEQVADRLITFLLENEDCFERSNTQGHVTASAWLVNKEETHVLLTHHKKLNMWLQLGGHADGEDNVLRVAQSEAEEESGLKEISPVNETIFDIDIHLIPARKDEPQHFHYDIRFAFLARDSDYIVSDESHDLNWIDMKHLSEFTEEVSMHRMAHKWFNTQVNVNIL